MAKLLFSGTHGSNDPTRAALPLLGAIGAVEAGHDVEVFLLGEVAYLMKDEIAGSVVRWPSPMSETCCAS